MTSLLEYLAKNEDASMLVSPWALQKIASAFSTRNYTIYNVAHYSIVCLYGVDLCFHGEKSL